MLCGQITSIKVKYSALKSNSRKSAVLRSLPEFVEDVWPYVFFFFGFFRKLKMFGLSPIHLCSNIANVKFG